MICSMDGNDYFTKFLILGGQDSFLTTTLYLSGSEIAYLEICSKKTKDICRDEVIWERFCVTDYGLTGKLSPPVYSKSPIETFRQTYKLWRTSFQRYSFLDVKLIHAWWKRLETWSRFHALPVYNSLGEPLTDQAIDDFEIQSETSFPSHLRLLYRFHNGQNIVYDERAQNGCFVGLFGGYQYYNHITCMRLLSLSDVEDSLDRVIFGSDITHPSHKSYCCNDAGDVFIMNERSYKLLKCHPPIHDSKKTQFSCGLYLWLEEYLSRLESGVYRVAPIVLTSDSRFVPRTEERMISLYPQQIRSPHQPSDTRSSAVTDVGVCGCEGVAGHRGIPPEEGGMVVSVTNGIEVCASPIFVPEMIDFDTRTYFWCYSIRMRLLASHPSRPPTLSRCQLQSRYWEISAPNRPIEQVSGGGVVGFHPILDIREAQDSDHDNENMTLGDEGGDWFLEKEWPFEYQSCTTQKSIPGTMGGHLTFVPGTMERPLGSDVVKATVGPFTLTRPEFIY